MLANIIQCVSGIQRKQVSEIENYKGISIVSLKEEPNVLALQVKGNYYYGLGYFTLERVKACLDAMEGTVEEAMEREFSAAVEHKSPRISLGLAQYFNKLSDYHMVKEYHLQLEIDKQQKIIQEEKTRVELEKQQEKERLSLSAKLFKMGNRITPEDFLGLCKMYSIKLPLKTHGWVNNALYDICVTSDGDNFTCDFKYYSRSKQSRVINDYAIELYKKLTDEPIEATSEELEHLFGLTRTAAQ